MLFLAKFFTVGTVAKQMLLLQNDTEIFLKKYYFSYTDSYLNYPLEILHINLTNLKFTLSLGHPSPQGTIS